MDREEQRKVAAKRFGETSGPTLLNNGELCFLMGSQWADNNPECPWTRVDDFLPNFGNEAGKSEKVFVLFWNGEVDVDVFNWNTQMWVKNGARQKSIVAWMYIPMYSEEILQSLNICNGVPFIDLGLPSGTLWATCNVGANLPEQAGLYFAWGETIGFTAEQVARGERLFLQGTYGARYIEDNLILEQDAAHANLGDKWRMPTKAEFQELIDNCDAAWTDDYKGTGVAGQVFTSKTNGNSVFFPAAGGGDDSLVFGVGSVGSYWSASWNSANFAWDLYFHSGSPHVYSGYRFFGRQVRGVKEK